MCVKHRRLFLWRIAKPPTLQMSVRYFVISLLFCSITTKFAYHQANTYFPRKWRNKIKICPHAKNYSSICNYVFEGDPLPLRQRHNITCLPNTILFQIHFSLKITFETLRRFCFKKIEFVKHEIEIWHVCKSVQCVRTVA